jgi:hypothetical protein
MAEQHWDAAGEVRVIAPSTNSVRIFFVAFGSITVIGGLITLITVAHGVRTLAGTRALGSGLIMLVMGGLAFVTMWMWSGNARLFIGRGTVGYRNILRRSRFWSRGEIGHVLDMAVNHGWTSQTQRGLYFLGMDGRLLLALTPRMWDAKDLNDFIDATGGRLDQRSAPVPAKAVRREFPAAFGWGFQHVLLATGLTMAVAVMLAIAGYVLLSR